MEVLYHINLTITGILVFFLVVPLLSILISLLFGERKEKINSIVEYDFGCIITAYKNIEITKPLVQSLLNQKHLNYHIYLVADNCNGQEFDLSDPRLTFLLPETPLNLKAKSIIYAMDNFVRQHDFTVIFDGDNLAHPEFLKIINQYANLGHKSIQGQRTAKNLDTIYAAMDSLGEFYKNYIDRYVPYLLGSSSVISGSGMAVETGLYRSYLDGPEIQKGKELWKKMLQEDKILQNFLLNKNEKIVYAWDAICYDEKVGDAQSVETQRSRWLFSYFQNLPNSSGLVLKGILNLSWNQFYFGLVTLAPPLFILVGFALIWMVLNLLFNPWMSLILFAAIFLFGIGVLLSLYLSRVPKQVWQSIIGLPFFILKQITALFKMRNPNKYFKHTEHRQKVSIDDVLSQK
jgi:cellulose synthase/poly-beta-1,6-N-acetylglucosamine synthase-like glycosyltransferase